LLVTEHTVSSWLLWSTALGWFGWPKPPTRGCLLWRSVVRRLANSCGLDPAVVTRWLDDSPAVTWRFPIELVMPCTDQSVCDLQTWGVIKSDQKNAGWARDCLSESSIANKKTVRGRRGRRLESRKPVPVSTPLVLLTSSPGCFP